MSTGPSRRISFVTLGARDVRALAAFYERWGWPARPGGTDDFAAFEAGDVRLALYRLDLLRDEAAPGGALTDRSAWNGVTLAVNLLTQADVDAELEAAVAAGAQLVAQGTHREWGGYSGYVADPEGNRWEIAWAPAPGDAGDG